MKSFFIADQWFIRNELIYDQQFTDFEWFFWAKTFKKSNMFS